MYIIDLLTVRILLRNLRTKLNLNIDSGLEYSLTSRVTTFSPDHPPLTY